MGDLSVRYMHSLHANGRSKKREDLPTEKKRGDPSKGRKALEKSKILCSPSKVAKQWRNIPLRWKMDSSILTSSTFILQMVSKMSCLGPESLLLPHRIWKVKFVGESVDDCGGGYSECISEMCEELQVLLLQSNLTGNTG